jgi:maleate isomerase
MNLSGEEKIQFNHLPFSTISKNAQSIQMGLVILETDLTIETEFRHFLVQDETQMRTISLLNTRIPCDDQVTASNLTSMEGRFSDALSLFPNSFDFDVIGYGCTSASLLIGEQRIEKIIKSNVSARKVTTPLAAVKKGLKALNVSKIGYLSPYISEIAYAMCSDLEDDGFQVVGAATFNEDKDSIVGNIAPQSILDGIELLARKSQDLEAIFVSCTSLKCASIISEAEAKLGLPILSSNSALAWDMAKLSGAQISQEGKGKLFLV